MKEEDIRPSRVFDEYLRLAREDTVRYFSGVPREHGSCPGCEGSGAFAFAKHGFEYQECSRCLTLFVNPRPLAAAFARYYTESPSSKFWATTFYRETADSRREKLWRPKARAVVGALERYGSTGHAVVDIGGGYGLFAEVMRDIVGRSVSVIEPAPHLASVCRDNSIPVIQKFLEQVETIDLPEGPTAFVSFELVEHLHSPVLFLEHLKVLMQPGDLFLFTTLSSTGVDIQALWELSKSVSPPHHLNFLNPFSATLLLERLGLKVLEVSTPGKLDIDILVNDAANIRDRFWRTFVTTASEATKEEWQRLIATSGWSSHMMVVCRKV